MGNKRKHQEEEETKIAKKIKKLERKLQRRRRIISSDDSESDSERQVLSEQPSNSPTRIISRTTSPRASSVNQCEEVLELPRLISPIPETSARESIDEEPVITEPIPSGAQNSGTSDTLTQEEESLLGEDILQILGEAPQLDVALGKNIHKDIASRWQDILLKGLGKEIKEPIIKKYLIPANCNFLLAPILNPEAKAAIPDILQKRDSSILQKQSQIGVALAALSELTGMILRNETSKQVLLQPLSDACRILCDSHNIETKTRRSIIMSSINTSLRDALANTNRDKYLFGEDLSDKLKAAKSVQKTGESLTKINPVATSSKGTPFKNVPKNRNLNYRGPIQRKPPFKNVETSRGRPVPRFTRNTTTYSRPPPPPPKGPSPTRRNYRR